MNIKQVIFWIVLPLLSFLILLSDRWGDIQRYGFSQILDLSSPDTFILPLALIIFFGISFLLATRYSLLVHSLVWAGLTGVLGIIFISMDAWLNIPLLIVFMIVSGVIAMPFFYLIKWIQTD